MAFIPRIFPSANPKKLRLVERTDWANAMACHPCRHSSPLAVAPTVSWVMPLASFVAVSEVPVSLGGRTGVVHIFWTIKSKT